MGEGQLPRGQEPVLSRAREDIIRVPMQGRMEDDRGRAWWLLGCPAESGEEGAPGSEEPSFHVQQGRSLRHPRREWLLLLLQLLMEMHMILYLNFPWCVSISVGVCNKMSHTIPVYVTNKGGHGIVLE